jgi:hypothetical protein
MSWRGVAAIKRESPRRSRRSAEDAEVHLPPRFSATFAVKIFAEREKSKVSSTELDAHQRIDVRRWMFDVGPIKVYLNTHG